MSTVEDIRLHRLELVIAQQAATIRRLEEALATRSVRCVFCGTQVTL